jgi:hypothetical protein
MKRLPVLAALLLVANCGPAVPSMPPAPSAALSVSSIRADSDQRITALLGTSATPEIFASYNKDGPSLWARNFTLRLNFTGVAWDDSHTATLVSPLHVVMAAHYQRPVGSVLVFHDGRGRPQRRTLVAAKSLGIADVAVGRLDAPLPGSVKPYRLLPPSENYGSLHGCLAVVTDQHRRAFLHEISSTGGGVGFRYPDASRVSPHLVKNLIKGDSGNPSFVLVGGELVLVETHSTGGPGAGPFYSAPAIFAAINATMTELGGGHQLSVVPLAPF